MCNIIVKAQISTSHASKECLPQLSICDRSELFTWSLSGSFILSSIFGAFADASMLRKYIYKRPFCYACTWLGAPPVLFIYWSALSGCISSGKWVELFFKPFDRMLSCLLGCTYVPYVPYVRKGNAGEMIAISPSATFNETLTCIKCVLHSLHEYRVVTIDLIQVMWCASPPPRFVLTFRSSHCSSFRMWAVSKPLGSCCAYPYRPESMTSDKQQCVNSSFDLTRVPGST